MKIKITKTINPLIEFSIITIDIYIENAPNTIGFLLYRYGPVVTSFLVCGLIDTPNASVGPPFPILYRDQFDHIAKIAPGIKITENKINLNVSEPINTFP